MLSTAIIVFREVLEAGLVIGIVYAASNGIVGRTRWILSGLVVGLCGAGLVAIFAGEIATVLEGMGQELFNASVLLLAVFMLGWHNIWMERHGKELAGRIKDVGESVRSGSIPLYALATVVALAIMREGSEVVLFLYGIVAGGATELFQGAIVGLLCGGLVGTSIYFGLLRVPQRHLFAITGWLILLLAAGLASQAANYLVQADFLPALSGPVWDTSQFLSERSLVGESLKVLIGYDDRPLGIQLVFYLVTLIVIGGAMFLTRYNRGAGSIQPGITALVLTPVLVGSLLFSSLLFSNNVFADHKVYSPIVEGGENEIEFRGHHAFDSDSSVDGSEKWKATIGRGFTNRWFSEVVFEWEKEGSDSNKLVAIEWENILQLTEQGQGWADWGVYTAIVNERTDGEPNKIEFGPLMAKEFGRKLLDVNVIMERQIGSGAASEIEIGYRWDFRFRGNPRFEPAIQAYGSLGDVDDLTLDSEHLIGPAFYGKIRTDSMSAWKYDVGLLFGLTDQSPDTMVRFQIEYEF